MQLNQLHGGIIMDYEIVTLAKKTVAGITARTNNRDPAMAQIICTLWQRLYGEGIFAAISGKENEKSIGLYYDYESDEKGDYTMMTGCEVSTESAQPAGIVSAKIPAGKYAKFIVRGHMQCAVGEFWKKLWQTPLDRKFCADFEEYQGGGIDNAEIHIYIALN
jgi:predicted transcriptional regulator YdeE